MDVHSGHRSRMKERFLESGLDSFHDVNVLELLLFFGLPRGDTNPIAHALLERFGTLHGVLDASVEELMEIPGIGKNAAELIHLIPQLSRRYGESLTSEEYIIDSTKKAGAFLFPYFRGERRELVYMLCLDPRRRVVCCKKISTGDLDSAVVNIRAMVRTALETNAAYVILAHNHAGGFAVPSSMDVSSTRAARQALADIGVQLVDHLVMEDGDFVSMAESNVFI